MRREFADQLLKEMQKNDKIFLLVGDLGYKVFDSHFAAFPKRAINTGAAEQAMLDMAVGLAYDGKIPFCYSITPFLIFRPFETVRTYINHEKLNVKLVGSGRDRDYEHDGVSHWADDVKQYLDPMTNINQLWPQDPKDVAELVTGMVKHQGPEFISLRR